MERPAAWSPFATAAFLTLGLGHLTAAPPTLKVEDVRATPGNRFVAQVFFTHQESVSGYQVSLLYDSSVLTLKRISLEGSDVEQLFAPYGIEFFDPSVIPDYQPRAGLGSAGVIFDFEPPFESPQLAPGDRQSILSFQFEAAADPALIGTCTPLHLLPVDSEPGYTLIDGNVCFEGPANFVRADANNDGKVNIADAIGMLYALFMDLGPPNPCSASMDANGDRALDISDAVYLLQYQFLGGSPPPPPYPSCGHDPDEALDCPAGSTICP